MKEKPMLPDMTEWADETVAWFDSWRNSPRTDGWDDAQWQYMFDTAIVHSAVWGMSEFGMLGELRARLSYMGLDFPRHHEARKMEVRVTPLDEIKKRREAPSRKPRAANKKGA